MTNSREKDDYNVEKMSSWWIKLLAIVFGLLATVEMIITSVYVVKNKKILNELVDAPDGKMVIALFIIIFIVSFIIIFMLIFTIYRVGVLTDERNDLREETEILKEEIDILETKIGRLKTEIIKHKYD